MKRIIAIFLCISMMLTVFPAALASPGDENYGDGDYGEAEDIGGYDDGDFGAASDVADVTDDYWEDSTDVEDFYEDTDTIYDLENEVDDEDLVPIPEPIPPPEENDDIEATCPVCGAMFSMDADILAADDATCPVCGELLNGDFVSFDAENARQLQGEYVMDEIIVKFKEPWQVPGKEKQLQKEIEKVEKAGFVEGLGVYVIKVDELRQNPNGVLNRFKNNKFIEFVEPNYTLKHSIIPNDPGYTIQRTVLTAINASEGWEIMTGASGPIIAIVDSGVAFHPDLPPLLPGYSAVTSLSPNNDRLGHGTGVAGTVGAIGNNNLGGAGLNWNASIMPVKVDDANGIISVANMARGLMWAADNGAKIINLSMTTTADSLTLREAINYAYNKGCAIFASTGNDGRNSIGFPARYDNVMAVGATSNGTARASLSNYGQGMGVVALTSYYTTTASGGFSNMAGTSFSSPQAAGLASLVWALNPALTNDQVYSVIQQNCKPLGGGLNEQTGYGLIDIGATLKSVYAPEPPPSPNPEPIVPPETRQEVRTPPTITLTGFNEITLEYGQPYIEVGYSAEDCKGADLTAAVRAVENINIWKAGIYTVTYEVTDPLDTSLTARATRTVVVQPQPPAPPPKEAPKITIIGSNPIVLHRDSGTPYTEQMARAVDHDGTDISHLVVISSGSVNRTTAGTYTLTYSVTSPETGLEATATRNVRILAPNERRDPRAKYGFNGQAKQGAKVTHTGILSSGLGFMDLQVSSIDKNMTITAQLVDASTKKAVQTDKFSATGTKQYKIDSGRYELVVTIDQASGNSKYSINLTMPETAATVIYDMDEVPLSGLPQIAPIGSNPIILHIGGTPYFEQGARAVDYLGNNISGNVVTSGAPDTKRAGTYTITYTVTGAIGIPVSATREVRIYDPNDETTIAPDEVPLEEFPFELAPPSGTVTHVVIPGDSLWRISQKHLGTGTRWGEIYDLNKAVIGANPQFLCIGLELQVRLYKEG